MKRFFMLSLIISLLNCSGHGMNDENQEEITQEMPLEKLVEWKETYEFKEYNLGDDVIKSAWAMNNNPYAWFVACSDKDLRELWEKTKKYDYVIISKEVRSLEECDLSGVKCIIFSPESFIKNIPSQAFKNHQHQSNIESIMLHPRLQSIDKNAFLGTNLKEIIFPKNSQTKSIEEKAFSCCQNLKAIELPNSLESIGEGAFCQANLETINIPPHMKTIKKWTFQGCKNLKNITFPPHLTKIESFAFEGSGIKYIQFPETLQYIGEYAFKDTKIRECVIPTEVETIGKGAWENCHELGHMCFCPWSKIKKFHSSIFKNCTNLIYLDLPNNLEIIGKSFLENCVQIQKLILPQNMSVIKDKAFRGCCNIEELNLPINIKTVGEKVFKGCTNMIRISLPPNLELIRKETFCNCSHLKEISYAEESKLRTIQSKGFKNCSNLKRITFPPSLKNIENSVFDGCNNLQEAIIMFHELKDVLPWLKKPELFYNLQRHMNPKVNFFFDYDCSPGFYNLVRQIPVKKLIPWKDLLSRTQDKSGTSFLYKCFTEKTLWREIQDLFDHIPLPYLIILLTSDSIDWLDNYEQSYREDPSEKYLLRKLGIFLKILFRLPYDNFLYKKGQNFGEYIPIEEQDISHEFISKLFLASYFNFSEEFILENLGNNEEHKSLLKDILKDSTDSTFSLSHSSFMKFKIKIPHLENPWISSYINATQFAALCGSSKCFHGSQAYAKIQDEPISIEKPISIEMSLIGGNMRIIENIKDAGGFLDKNWLRENFGKSGLIDIARRAHHPKLIQWLHENNLADLSEEKVKNPKSS